MKRVLVTGISGLIGGIFRQYAAAKYVLSAVSRRPIANVDCHQADIADFEAIQPAFEGKDVVVHLAALAKADADFDDVLGPNIIGTYNVFEAARRAGVGRVIFASSGAVTQGYERGFPYNAITEGRYSEAPKTWEKVTHESAIRPEGFYGWSKAAGEAMARQYTNAYGMSVICLRIGRVNPQNRPVEPREFSVWCSHRDISQMLENCIEAPANIGFDLFYVVSNNKWSYRDISHAQEVVGYEPRDAAEEHRPSVGLAR